MQLDCIIMQIQAKTTATIVLQLKRVMHSIIPRIYYFFIAGSGGGQAALSRKSRQKDPQHFDETHLLPGLD